MSGDHVRVRAGGEHYAAPVRDVREIAPLAEITPVPGAPAVVLGVWNLRGDVVAAIDLGALLGLRSGELKRILVAEHGQLRAGLAVQEVIDVGPLPDAVDPADSPYLAGAVLVGDTPVGVLDLAALLGAVASGKEIGS